MTASEISIRMDDARELEQASQALLLRIHAAVQDFYADPPPGWRQWEEHRTPRPWERVAVANLERYAGHLRQAIRSLAAGDVEPITHAAAGYAGLSKDLDFDSQWMSSPHRGAVHAAIDRIVAVADRIHRAGYAVLSAGAGNGSV
jgi:hypothetical protein